MRTFKFRAWDKEFEMMFYSNSSDDPLNVTGERIHHLCGCKKPEGHLDYFFFEKAPIMQFTGLHDKHGKEIYEGDIVKQDRFDDLNGEFIAEVRWEGLGFDLFPNGSDHADILSFRREVEIIGNVYENPDLHKGE